MKMFRDLTRAERAHKVTIEAQRAVAGGAVTLCPPKSDQPQGDAP